MGYDAVRFIIEGVKARGGDTKDRPALVSAIEKVAYDGPRGPMKMAKNHQATQNVYIVKTVKKDDAVAFEIIDTYPNFEDPVKGCRSRLIRIATLRIRTACPAAGSSRASTPRWRRR